MFCFVPFTTFPAAAKTVCVLSVFGVLDQHKNLEPEILAVLFVSAGELPPTRPDNKEK